MQNTIKYLVKLFPVVLCFSGLVVISRSYQRRVVPGSNPVQVIWFYFSFFLFWIAWERVFWINYNRQFKGTSQLTIIVNSKRRPCCHGLAGILVAAVGKVYLSEKSVSHLRGCFLGCHATLPLRNFAFRYVTSQKTAAKETRKALDNLRNDQ